MKKSDKELLSNLKAIVARERLIVIELLRHLREVEARSLHLSYGYSSLFAFCVGELNFSEQETHLRIQGMRLVRDVPEAEEKINSGELSLTVAARVQGVSRKENLSPDEKWSVLEAVAGLSVREAERKILEFFPSPEKPEKKKMISGGKTRIEFNADTELMTKLERLKELLAHKNYDGRFDLLFEELADIALEKLEKNDAPLLSAHKVKHSRYIPAAVKRALPWKEGCNYTGAGRRCGSRYGLQVDHIHDYAGGGTNAPENLQLLCGAHNRFKSRKNPSRTNTAPLPSRAVLSSATSPRNPRRAPGDPAHQPPKD